MHLCEPRACIVCSDPLPIYLEGKYKQVVREKDSTEDSSDDGDIAIFKYPFEEVDSKGK